MEANFALFWGLAIQFYEATLVSDQTPFDRYQAGNQNALSPDSLLAPNAPSAVRGFAIFDSQGMQFFPQILGHFADGDDAIGFDVIQSWCRQQFASA